MKISIKAKPNSRESKIEKISKKEFTAHLKAPAKDNKANIELIKLLAKHFKTSSKSKKIKNPTSKNKIVEIKCQ